MIVLSICLTMGVCILIAMCYIACFKGSIGEEGEDFNELPSTRARNNTRTTDAINMTNELQEEKRKSVNWDLSEADDVRFVTDLIRKYVP